MAEAKTEGDSVSKALEVEAEREKSTSNDRANDSKVIENGSFKTYSFTTYSRWIAVLTPVVTVVAAIVFAQAYRNASGFMMAAPEQGMADHTMSGVDETVMSMFVEFDTNIDGAIDLSEFLPIANRVLERKVVS